MKKRIPILLPIAALTMLPFAVAADLTLEASEAAATIAPRKNLRVEVPLPPLTFDIVVRADCEGTPESLTVSVADTHRTWAGSEIAENGIVEASIGVPFPQLSLVIGGSMYCLAGETEDFRPAHCGVIVADTYDAEIVRPAPLHPLAAARRKVEIERLARTALRRQLVQLDPRCSAWGSA